MRKILLIIFTLCGLTSDAQQILHGNATEKYTGAYEHRIVSSTNDTTFRVDVATGNVTTKGLTKSRRFQATDTIGNGNGEPAFNVERTLSSELSASGVGYNERTTITRSQSSGYTGYLVQTNLGASISGRYGLFMGFVNNMGMNTLDTLTEHRSFSSQGAINNSSGRVRDWYGYFYQEPTGSGQIYDKQSAIRIQNFTKGTNRWAIQSYASAPSAFLGNVGIGIATDTVPRRRLELGAGTTAVAPLGLNSGTALTTPVDGSLEYHSSHLYFTIGSTRYQLDQQTGGFIPYTDTLSRKITTKYALDSTVASITAGGGITNLNGLTGATQSFATGTSGTDFNISSATSTHTFNFPTASATNRGLLSSTDWSTFNGKQAALGFTPEDVANKATSFGTINNTLYPTVQACSTYIAGLGYITGNQSITLSGDVTGSGTTSISTTIANGAVTLAKMANMATASILGRNTAGTGAPEVLSASTVKNILSLGNVENTALSTWAGSANITTVGTISSGTWNGGIVAGQYGGTGVANTGKTITVSGNTTIGSSTNTVTLATTGNTNVTLPTSGTLATLAGSETLTNKTLTSPIISSISNTGTLTLPTVTSTITSYKESNDASTATPTPVGDARQNKYYLTALATAPTFAAPSGTPANGNELLIRIKDNGTARSLAWNAIYRGGTSIALPTTTTISKTMYVQFVYNSADSKWDLVGLTDGL